MSSFLNNESGLPLVFANGLPASLDELNEAQLECFLKYLWDFTEVPSIARVLPPRTINPKTRIINFKTVIRNVYARLGCRYLLHLSEGIALKCNRKTLLFEHVTLGNQKLVNLYDERKENLIVSVPRSNLTYDLALQQKLKKESSKMGYSEKKSMKHGGDIKEVISLIDSDDEDSSDDIIFVPNPDVTQNSKSSFKTKHFPKICTSNTMKKKSDIEKYLSFQNTELILLPNPNAVQKNFKLSNEDDSMPKIEYSISLPADEANNISYFISSDSDVESEKNLPIVDPLALNIEGQDKSITLDTDSDSKDEPKPKLKPEVLKSPVKKISPVKRTVAYEMKRYFREVTPPKTCGNESSSSTNRQQVVITKRILNEKPYPLNQTYSQIKHAKEIKRKVLTDSRKEKSEKTKSQKILKDIKKDMIKSRKVNFANALGLYELSDSMDDDIIILPEVNRKHFLKFHRLPLSMVPYLVARDLIDEASLTPGPPGQNSRCTSTDNIDLTRRRSGRTSSSSIGRHRMNDLKKARDYVFPNKTYRTRTPVPLPTKKRKMPGPPLFPKPNIIPKLPQVKPERACSNKVTGPNNVPQVKPERACSNKVTGPNNVPQVFKPEMACSNKMIGPKSVIQLRKPNLTPKKVTNITNGATQPDSSPSIKENGPSTMCNTSSLNSTMKECHVCIQKLNPFIVRYYSKKLN